MDFLAGSSSDEHAPLVHKLTASTDVASHHTGQPQVNGRLARNSVSRENKNSPTMSTPPSQQYLRSALTVPFRRSTPPISRPRAGSIMSVGEIPLGGDTPTIVPRKFVAPSLSQADLDSASELTKKLADNSYSYDSHIQLINILHNGFLAHIFPSGPESTFHEPHLYPLLADLRQARQAMDSRFPVGEKLWVQWIEDECMLARTVEDRVTVMELCQKATQEEVGSAKLWRLYGDWMWLLYKTTQSLTGGYENNTLETGAFVGRVLERRRWTEDEKTVGQEVFSWNPMLDVWIQAMKAVEWHIDDSSLVWDPYVQILNHDLSRNPSADKVKHVWTLFADRLQKPHASWPDTFQGFSQFVSANYDESIYEETMVAANKQSVNSKSEFELRQEYEASLIQATEAEDTAAEAAAMAEYLEWESNQQKRKSSSSHDLDLYIALLERANLRFPTVTEWWEDHVDLVLDHPQSNHDILSLVHRASRHCPWSGNLWSKHLLAYEVANREFVELEDIKHRATSTGLLEEVGGMDELIKVYTAWCGFLRRRAFGPKSGEEESDVAEMGIRSVIENVKDIGSRKYGTSFKGDPLFRAEKIYLKFLSHHGRYEEARETWSKLVATHGDMYDFWDRYYLWEMTIWGRTARDFSQPPDHATNVLRQATRRPNLDYPEKVIDLYLHHCGQHETIQKLQEAHVEARRATKLLAKRREKEAAEAAAKEPFPQAYGVAEHDATSQAPSTGDKRKHADGQNRDGPVKRARSAEPEIDHAAVQDAPMDVNQQVKRDREHTTIIVKGLPVGTTELQVRKFFRECGEILTLQLVGDDNAETLTATIEFGSKEDVLTAQTKSMKPFEGHPIEIQVGTGTTLWVTNYPPEADDAFFRNLFEEVSIRPINPSITNPSSTAHRSWHSRSPTLQFGTIVNIRFPSLKFNTHRRFCYIQFLTAAEAKAATRLDGVALGKGFHLQAKISDPSARQPRSGAQQDGREIFIGNLSWTSSEADLRALFESNGHTAIESVRIPRNIEGKSKGSAFIIFAKREDAEAALAMDLKEHKGRALKVNKSVANATGAKRSATTIISAASASPEPSTGTSLVGEDTIMADGTSTENQSSSKTHHARTLLLRNIPDTINDARIRTLMAPYGSLRKITLRPEKQQALVEFEDIRDSGKAELGIQGHEIAAGVHIEVGRMDEARKDDQSVKKSRQGGPTFNPTQIRRPGQAAGARRGGKGGLGYKRAVITAGDDAKTTNGATDTIVNGDGDDKRPSSGTKSNADFRAMLQNK